MKKILVLCLFVLLFSSCNLSEIGWSGHYRVRMSATGDAKFVNITIKYQDETSGYRTVELKNQTLPFEYPLEVYRGFGVKRVYVSILAKNTEEDFNELTYDGEAIVRIEYDVQKDGQYWSATYGRYDYKTGDSETYLYID